MKNEEFALKNFIKIENKILVIIRVLQKELIKFKNKRRNDDVEEALLKINTFFSFYNITNKYCLVPIEELKEK